MARVFSKRDKILRQQRSKPTHSLGVYDVPVEAIELAADIESMEIALQLLKRLRVHDEGAEKVRWSISNEINKWIRNARDRMKKEYLAK